MSPFSVQIKRRKNCPAAEIILNSIKEEANPVSGIPILVQRGDKGKWIVSLFLEDFIVMAALYDEKKFQDTGGYYV